MYILYQLTHIAPNIHFQSQIFILDNYYKLKFGKNSFF